MYAHAWGFPAASHHGMRLGDYLFLYYTGGLVVGMETKNSWVDLKTVIYCQ